MKHPVLTLPLLLLLLCTGCGTTAKFVYPDQMSALVQVDSAPVHKLKVAVTPFDDERSAENVSGTLFLYLIPLMPYSWVEYDRPDAARMFLSIAEYEFTPSEDLAKAAALSLRRSNLFEDAFFTFGGEKSNADLVLSGKIKSTKYLGRLITYGLSFEGPLLWFFGLPCGTSDNTLALQLQLRRNGKIIWDYTYDRTSGLVQGLYYSFGRDCLDYSTLMRECMNEAILDLNKHLRDHPALLKEQ